MTSDDIRTEAQKAFVRGDIQDWKLLTDISICMALLEGVARRENEDVIENDCWVVLEWAARQSIVGKLDEILHETT